jgi:hypothetical protein
MLLIMNKPVETIPIADRITIGISNQALIIILPYSFHLTRFRTSHIDRKPTSNT